VKHVLLRESGRERNGIESKRRARVRVQEAKWPLSIH
jgi:hypothetical protein